MWDVLFSWLFSYKDNVKVTHWPELENILGKLPSWSRFHVCFAILKMKLQPTMKLGPPPPFGYHAKRTDDAGTSSEDDGLPRSPPEMSLFQEILSSGTTVRVSSSGADKKQCLITSFAYVWEVEWIIWLAICIATLPPNNSEISYLKGESALSLKTIT